MKAIDFLTVTKMNEARYSDYILFKADEAVTVEMFGGSARDGNPRTPPTPASVLASPSRPCFSPARLVSGAIPADTAMVSVYDSELLGCLNEAGAKADAVVRIEGETPYFVFIYSLE